MNASNDDEFNAELNAMNAAMQGEVDSRNRQGLDVFSGLSPMQMSAILYKPFDSPDVLTFPKTIEGADAPILRLFLLLAERVGEKGIKLTATGNLPRNLCREVAQVHLGEDGYLKRTEFAGINKETDFYDLHIMRLVAGLAKLTRKYKGKILLTTRAAKLLKAGQHGELYMHLFKAYTTEFNWGYWDAYPELQIMQMAFAYHIHGWQGIGSGALESYRSVSHLLGAFPMMIDEVMDEESEYIRSDPAGNIEQCYNLRVLHRFGEFLGLLSLESVEKKEVPYLTSHYVLRAKPLLSQVVVFM